MAHSVDKSLNLLSKERYHMCTWWYHAYHDHSFSKKNRIIIRLLLNVFIYMEKICPCCDLQTVNDVVHVLFVCPCNSHIREVMWKDVKDNTPVELFRRIELMDLLERTIFLLNACNSDYIREWKRMFDAMSL